ncbi:MAG: hypothetical protein NWS46_12670 [Cyclobacteriaceae bacterium]|jgi:hypothetical protein|nr:hypothetical protein [Cyclobacteriaceae bacterium]
MPTSLLQTRERTVSIKFDVSKIKEKTVQDRKEIPNQIIKKKNKRSVANFITQTIKNSLDAEMLDLFESYISVRLTSMIRNSLQEDKYLSLKKSQYHQLENFDFNNSNPFISTVLTKVFVKGGSHNGYAILHVPAFVPEFDLTVPADATNFKISAKLIAISDFIYAEEPKAYISKNIEANGNVGSFETTMLPVLKIQTQPITSQICINRCEPMGNEVSTILVLAFKFYKYNKGKFMHLSENGTMKIMNIF